jgi:BASS family bile acid:Na+ symporter
MLNLFEKANAAFTKYLSWIVILMAALALSLPSLFTWVVAILTFMLQFIMFTMGLTMSPSDFAEVLKKPWRVFFVVLAQYLFMPFMAFVLSWLFQLPAEIALGMILVGSVPGGTSSNVIAYLANGDLPLSISATSVSTLLSPIMTPLMLSLYGGAYLEIQFMDMFMSIVQVVMVPVLLGLAISYFLGERTKKVETVLPTFSSIAILLVLAGTVAVNQQNLLETGLLIFFVVWLHNLSGYAISYLLCKLFHQDASVTRAMAIEVAIQNTSLAASLGLAHFSPLSALAGAAGTITHTLFGTIYANLCRNKDRKEEKKVENVLEHTSNPV